MNKREFLKKSFAISAGAIISAPLLSTVSHQDNILKNKLSVESKNDEGLFKQQPLDYAYDALEPYVDAKTMELHYSKHHAGYTSKFNEAVQKEGITGKSLEEIFAGVSKFSDAVRNNGGGYYNHNLYWKFMSPDGGGEPVGKIAKAIKKSFGSFDAFKEQFSGKAASQFGSGWGWLIMNKNGDLEVTGTPNQDNPLMDIAGSRGVPLLNIDVWEHAYYLNYQNRRADYIAAYWNVINWKFVEELYLGAIG